MHKEIQISDLKSLDKKNFIITDNNIYGLYKKSLPEDVFVILSGEKNKTLQTVERLILDLQQKGADRNSTLVALGGGIVGDIVGFTASIYMRGISWICVPTTVTAFADSSIGGKTAVNLGAKNLVGSFHLPKAVYRCYDFLNTLPRTEIANGMAEVFKTSLLNSDLFDKVDKLAKTDIFAEIFSTDKLIIEANNNNNNSMLDIITDNNPLESAIITNDNLCETGIKTNKNMHKPLSGIGKKLCGILDCCANVKQLIVDKDFLDKGQRKSLNLGHTVGHALELTYGLSHGTSVAIGLCAESYICGITPPNIFDWIKSITKPYFTSLDFKIDAFRLTSLAELDKKNNAKISVLALSEIGKTQELFFSADEFRVKLDEFFAYYSK